MIKEDRVLSDTFISILLKREGSAATSSVSEPEDSVEESAVCPICMEALDISTRLPHTSGSECLVARLDCRHEFHLHCLCSYVENLCGMKYTRRISETKIAPFFALVQSASRK